MILQRLAEHYERLEAPPRPGFSQQKISFCIVLELDGRFHSIEDMRRQNGKTMQPRIMVVPGQSKPTGSGLNPCFLWDNAEYLLGWNEDAERSPRALRAFEASRTMHLAQEQEIATPSYTAVCRFLRDWSVTEAEKQSEWLKQVATHFGVFRIAGEHGYVHESVSIPSAAGSEGATPTSAMCLVTGTHGPSARLHEPKIKGVADAQSSGALLVSFNAPAFTSYGREQSFNAPVSSEAVFKYANALNHLLEQRDRRIGVGDATVVFWADHAEPVLEDCLAEMCGGSVSAAAKEDEKRVEDAHRLLNQMRAGTRKAAVNTDDGKPTKFYILGLSPNASRLSVRLWIEADAWELERRLGEHLRDLELKSNFDERPLSIRAMASATGRYDAKGKAKFDTKGVSPQLAGELARSVLTGAAYPQSLLATMVRRIRSDAYVGYERVSAIRACLVRNSRLRGAPLEVPVELDVNDQPVAYRCGRLFALLENIQKLSVKQTSNVELNATIKDRYFSSASSTPALVFPRLCRLSQHHLAKIEPTKLRNYFEREIGRMMVGEFIFPRQLSLADQGLFIVGYYQQREFRKAETPSEETQA
jgi:CRISPR-associated protein Csd1